jgi:hypothetical protein
MDSSSMELKENKLRAIGEFEFLKFMRLRWPYGGKIFQLDGCWMEKDRLENSASVFQILECLVAQGEVVEIDGIYKPV